MKLSLIADIHGNLPALEAVLQHARAQGAAHIILNLGDMTGYGPFPDEVVRWSQSPKVTNIMGNYDQKVLSKQHRKNRWHSVKTADKRRMFQWTYRALSKKSRKFIKSLPEQRLLEFDRVQLLMTHGSPTSLTEHLRQDTPETHLAELSTHTRANIVLCGHSHQAFKRKVNGVLFVNPGTVGRPDDGDPRASYAILDISQGHVSVTHFRIPYNTMATVRALRQAGLPDSFTWVVRYGLNYQDATQKMAEATDILVPDPNGEITLLTDFGLQDHFVGVMKGVIASIAPQARVIDISHQVQPQNIRQAGRMLAEAAPYFPPGTVHIAVVDPGVGTNRRGIAARIGPHFFVAPDNGLLTPHLTRANDAGEPVQIVALNKKQYWLPEISTSFHGRDIFSPIGAHLANGLTLHTLGHLIDDPIRLTLPQPRPIEDGWQAEVALVDVFGNLSTNLPASALPDDLDKLTVTINNETIHGLTRAFADRAPGTLIAIIDSTNALGISLVNGNAAKELHAKIGTPVVIKVT